MRSMVEGQPQPRAKAPAPTLLMRASNDSSGRRGGAPSTAFCAPPPRVAGEDQIVL
jgi:hypothetical protein